VRVPVTKTCRTSDSLPRQKFFLEFLQRIENRDLKIEFRFGLFSIFNSQYWPTRTVWGCERRRLPPFRNMVFRSPLQPFRLLFRKREPSQIPHNRCPAELVSIEIQAVVAKCPADLRKRQPVRYRVQTVSAGSN